MTDKYL